VSPFKRGKGKYWHLFLTQTPFEVINQDNSDVLCKFVLTRISGKPRVAITHGNLENCEDLGAFLKNTYTDKRTLDFHATQLFGANRAKMIVFQSGSRTSRGLAQDLGRQPCKTAKIMNG